MSLKYKDSHVDRDEKGRVLFKRKYRRDGCVSEVWQRLDGTFIETEGKTESVKRGEVDPRHLDENESRVGATS